MHLLKTKNLSIGYDSQQIVQADINICLQSSECLAIQGYNGSGKSSLVKTLLDLIPVISGEIIKSPTLKTAYIAQENNFDPLFPDSVEEFLDQTTDLVHDEFLNIRHLLKKQMRDLSSGQRQRVYLARALFTPVNLLIIDEIFNHLDSQYAEKIEKLLIQLRDKEKLGIIYIDHDIERMDRIANKKLLLKL